MCEAQNALVSSRLNRVEKSSRHVSMVAKTLDLNKSSMAAMSISALASFFAEPKSINRGENHYNSKHVESLEYADGVMRGNVHASTVEPRLSGPRLSGLFDYPDFFSGPVDLLSGPVFFMNINKL